MKQSLLIKPQYKMNQDIRPMHLQIPRDLSQWPRQYLNQMKYQSCKHVDDG